MIETQKPSAIQKSYQKPQLKLYGSVQTLTAGGSGADTEDGPNCSKMPPVNGSNIFRKACT